jgi:nuclear transcription factor Y gamma
MGRREMNSDQFPMMPFFMGQPMENNYDPIVYHQAVQLQDMSLQEHLENLDRLLQAQHEEIDRMTVEDLKNHQLPLARIKKIMKSDEDVRMISAEAPAVFAKACEMFIIEITYRAWLHTEENKRRTLQRNDISMCIQRTDIFDFLIDIVPPESKRNTQD